MTNIWIFWCDNTFWLFELFSPSWMYGWWDEEGSSPLVTGPPYMARRLTLRELCCNPWLTWNLGCVFAFISNKIACISYPAAAYVSIDKYFTLEWTSLFLIMRKCLIDHLFFAPVYFILIFTQTLESSILISGSGELWSLILYMCRKQGFIIFKFKNRISL